MGVAVGDVDNDGFQDLYVTAVGPNVLYRNRGDGTFEDVTARAGVDDPRWSDAARRSSITIGTAISTSSSRTMSTSR